MYVCMYVCMYECIIAHLCTLEDDTMLYEYARTPYVLGRRCAGVCAVIKTVGVIIIRVCTEAVSSEFITVSIYYTDFLIIVTMAPKSRVGVRLKEAAGGKSHNRSVDLEELSKSYETLKKRIAALIQVLKNHHCSMMQMTKTRLKVSSGIVLRRMSE